MRESTELVVKAAKDALDALEGETEPLDLGQTQVLLLLGAALDRLGLGEKIDVERVERALDLFDLSGKGERFKVQDSRGKKEGMRKVEYVIVDEKEGERCGCVTCPFLFFFSGYTKTTED